MKGAGMRLYRTFRGPLIESESVFYQLLALDWDELVNLDDLQQRLTTRLRELEPLTEFSLVNADLSAPIGEQEVWGAGVTYYRSRSARIEESKIGGAADFYDRVYEAERPELFFKASPHHVAGHSQNVRIRTDSKWNVPEPELTLFINSSGKIIGYTIGNDMSSRDIEGENPLYLPQAKIYNKSCALGPGILLSDSFLPASTEIKMDIVRKDTTVFSGTTLLSAMKRPPEILVEFLFRENSFPHGCFLMTGTGIVPPQSFTLQKEDQIRITIEPIGTLVNQVQ
jgi:2-dehydro-3-deoxy-D-arabinonate dehydratase